jgi:hyperosmotically inducible periplasmic protein
MKSHFKFRHAALLAALMAVGCSLAEPGFGISESQAADTQRSAGAVIDDGVITAKVKSTLIADSIVKGFDFKVETRDGVVQLSGFVDNSVQVNRAVALATNVEGVVRVDNKVSLKTGTQSLGNKVDDSVVTARVKSALLSDSDIKGVGIGVTTRKGVVQLSGFVDSASQAERAIQVARNTEGVQSVNNEMSVKN